MAYAQAVAEKIEKKARNALEPLAREMKIMGWPAQFQAIMWEAVAHSASLLAAEAATVHQIGERRKKAE